MGVGLAPSRSSNTSLALGARKRKVTLLSACTSGEMSFGKGGGGGGVACDHAWPGNAAATNNANNSAVVFIASLVLARSLHDEKQCLNAASIQQTFADRRVATAG